MTSPDPLVTVAICTFNRAASLDRTLRRLATISHPPAGTWEVVVIDNGSGDSTRDVINEAATLLPLRSFHEPVQGLSSARNRAVREARGRWIVWTDDDVLVGSRWLQVYHDELKGSAATDILGGPVVALPDAEPDTFVAEALRRYPQIYAVVDLGPRRIGLSPGRVPYGANMVIRRELLIARGFDTNFGSLGTVQLLGDDTIRLDELLSGGSTGVWLPDAGVLHCLPVERLTESYVRRWAFAGGRTHFREAMLRVGRDRTAFRMRVWLWRRAFGTLLRHRLRPARTVAARVVAAFEVETARGIIAELRSKPRTASSAGGKIAVAG